ncbi:MAG: phosphatase PAP2 family protein [Pseudomonadota bacterium]
MTHRFWIRHALLPLLIAAPILIGLEFTEIDRWISDWFYSAANHGFPLRDNFWLEVVLHHWIKYLVIAIAIAVLLAWAISSRVPRLSPWRTELLYSGVAMTAASATISGLKALSSKACPYDLEIYGGDAPYTRLFDFALTGGHHGHCFPGGHASTGFVLFAFYFASRARRPRWAKLALLTAFSAGMVLGFSRVAQGAHFLSHQLWTALICWYVALTLYGLMLHRRNGYAAIGTKGET